MKDITNQVFGSLTAIKPDHNDKYGNWYWVYQCKCGKEHIARSNTVKYELRKNDPELPSCGCVELARKTKHGFRTVSKTHPAYRAYNSMMNRCYNAGLPEYRFYGAKGVTVCEQWKNNPLAFVEWSLNNGWKEGYVIDKDILSDQLKIFPHVYSPETCQWIDHKLNLKYANDRRNYGKHPNIRLSYEEVSEILELYNSGKVTNKSELARMFNVANSTIHRLIELDEQTN